jgi:hypothetical protein
MAARNSAGPMVIFGPDLLAGDPPANGLTYTSAWFDFM